MLKRLLLLPLTFVTPWLDHNPVEPPSITIAVIGDSNTKGSWKEAAWAEHMASNLYNGDAAIINVASPGSTASDDNLLGSVKTGQYQVDQLESKDYDFAIVALGTNDFYVLDHNPQQVFDDIKNLTEQLDNYYVCLVPRIIGEYSFEIEALNNMLIEEYSDKIIDFHNSTYSSVYYLPDGVHFNILGRNLRASTAYSTITNG